jgi:glycosyltransferase involved in cell wall biosynthesis
LRKIETPLADLIRLLVISNYRYTVTVRPEAEIFLQLRKEQGYDITIMTEADTEYAEKFRQAGIKVIDFHIDQKFSWKVVQTIRAELLQGSYHILQLFNNKALTHGIFAARGLPIKIVAYRGYTGNIHWADPFMYVKYLHPRVDRIICLVEAIRQLFRKNLLFHKDKAVTIHKGHDVTWYHGVEPMPREELQIPSDAFTFICGANSRRMKGIKYLLRATYLLPANMNFRLLLAGRDMDLPQFKKLIDDSPHKKNIVVLGFVNKILSVVKASDVFVLPSIKGEAITKSVIEAMSLGVCPLITDIDGNYGLVSDKQCGLVVPSGDPKALADAMMTLYQNRAQTRNYGQAAREHIRQNFNNRKTVVEYDALYKELYQELKSS